MSFLSNTLVTFKKETLTEDGKYTLPDDDQIITKKKNTTNNEIKPSPVTKTPTKATEFNAPGDVENDIPNEDLEFSYIENSPEGSATNIVNDDFDSEFEGELTVGDDDTDFDEMLNGVNLGDDELEFDEDGEIELDNPEFTDDPATDPTVPPPEDNTGALVSKTNDDNNQVATPINDDPTSPIDESQPGNEPDVVFDEDVPADNTNIDGGTDEFSNAELGVDGDDSLSDPMFDENKEDGAINILNSIPKNQYKQLNLRLYGMFKKLIDDAETAAKVIINNIMPENDRESQVLSIVQNNLFDMIESVEHHLESIYGDNYEKNALAYTAYLKRYKIALEIIYKVKMLQDKRRSRSKK